MTGSIRTDMETTFTRRNSHGANLKRWREWRGIKQEVLADKIGVSQATLSGYEKKDELEPEVLEKITKALDIPTEAITELNEGALINIYSGTWQDNATAAGSIQNQTFNPIDKIVESSIFKYPVISHVKSSSLTTGRAGTVKAINTPAIVGWIPDSRNSNQTIKPPI